MANIRLVRGRGRVFPKRSTAWSSTTSITSYTALAANTVILDQVAVPQVLEQTIVRIRGLLVVRSDQVSANENVHGAFGIALVEEPAASVGVTAVPSPITDAAQESWLVWQAFASSLILATAVGIASPGVSSYVIDSKAMRKVTDSQRLVILLENNSGSAGMDYWFHLRILAMLKS